MNRSAFLAGYLGRGLPRHAFLEGYLHKEAGISSWFRRLLGGGRVSAKTLENLVETAGEHHPDVASNIVKSLADDAAKLGLSGEALDKYVLERAGDITKNIDAVKPGMLAKAAPWVLGGGGFGAGGFMLGSNLAKKKNQAPPPQEMGVPAEGR